MNLHLIESWQIHNRINVYLLESLTSEALEASMNAKSRTVFALFAHIHNVRLMWLKSAAPDLLAGIDKLEAKPNGTIEQLSEALTLSGQAIEALLTQSLAEGGKISGFKPHPTAFACYLISHESHHRGQIEWALRMAGMPLPDKVSYGL